MEYLKVRAWNKSCKEMYWRDGKFDGELLEEIAEGNHDDMIILQYTGLKDKQGQEIYEGDIVSCGSGKNMAVIYQAPKFIMKEKIKSGFSKYWSEFILSPEQNQFEEVIGNIYENYELLEIK